MNLSFLRRVAGERGDINLALVALSLPIVLMLGIAAADIIRVIINKQQLYAAVQSGYDYLLAEQGGAGWAKRLYGRNRCVIVPDNLDNTCRNCETANPPTCTGSPTPGSDGPPYWTGTPLPLVSARDAIANDVNTGNGVFNMGPITDNDLSIIVAAYDLIVGGATAATAAASQTVIDKELLDRVEIGPYTPNIDTDAWIDRVFIDPGTVKVGSIYGDFGANTPNATHVTVIILWATYRVDHIFSFPEWLRLGIQPVDKGSGALTDWSADETYVSASLVRVVPYGARLD